MHRSHFAGFMALVFASITLCFAFRPYWNSPVKGSITPADAGIRAWVFSKTDTLNAPVLQGNFMIEHVKPGRSEERREGKECRSGWWPDN